MNKANDNWKGLTLDELRMRRAKSYVLSEVSKERLMETVRAMQESSKQYGIKGLFYSNSFLKNLKFADYMLLGGKVAMWGFKFWRKRKK